MWCAVKPPDDVCDACDFDLYDAQSQLGWNETNDDIDGGDGDDGGGAVSVEPLNGRRRRRRRLTSSDNSASSFGSGSGSASYSSSFSARSGLSEECGACLVSGPRESQSLMGHERCVLCVSVSSLVLGVLLLSLWLSARNAIDHERFP